MQINVGILGLGTVGSGTATVLLRNADLLRARTAATFASRKSRRAHRAAPVLKASVSHWSRPI
jgi:homoserine dehydrogenase